MYSLALIIVSAIRPTVAVAQPTVARPAPPQNATSQNVLFTPWPQAPSLPDADEEHTRAAFAADGKKVAFQLGNRLWVHRVAPTGALGLQIYTSPPTQNITAFVWAGQKLFVSRRTGSKAETVSLTLATNSTKTSETVLFPVAAVSLKLAPGGGALALVPFHDATSQDTQIDFYRRTGEKWARSGSYLRPGTGALERYWKDSRFGKAQWLYLLDWNDDGRGVFAVVPAVSGEDGKPPPVEQQLCLVLPEGKALPLSRPGDIGPYFRPNMLPMAGVFKREGVRAVPLGHEFGSEFGPLKPPRAIYTAIQPPAWLDRYKRGTGRLISYLPATRYALQQKESETDTSRSELIVSDLEAGQWKRLGSTASIVRAFGWNANRLLVRTGRLDREGKPAGALQWGVVRITLPIAQATPQTATAQAAIAQTEDGWIKTVTERDQPNEAEQVVLEFFKISNVASYAPLRPFYDDFRSETEAGRPQGFSFRGREYEPYIRVDAQQKRVVFFDGSQAQAPLPDAPITPEKAQQNALAFVGALNPTWTRAAPKIEVAPLGSGLNYRVRFEWSAPLPAGAPALCLVHVRASDGQINGYNEDQNRINTLWQSWQQAAQPQEGLPFDSLRPSPDGRFLLFRWNAPRPGSPLWWKNRPLSLYLLDLQAGNTPPTLIASESGVPVWSPDSQRFAFLGGSEGYHIYQVKSGKRQNIPLAPGNDTSQRLLGWKSNTELLFGFRVAQYGYPDVSGMDLRIFRTDAPTSLPSLWQADWSAPLGYTGGFKSAVVAPDAKSVAVVWETTPPARRREGDALSLFLAPLTGPAPGQENRPRPLRTDHSSSLNLMWTSAGIFSWNGSASNGLAKLTLTDPTNGTTQPWTWPAPVAQRVGPLMKATSTSTLAEPGLRFSADGKTLFFMGMDKDQSPAQAKIYASDSDGQNVRVLFSPPPAK